MSSASDVTVFGVTMGGHFIEDINVHVPQNMTVVIPAEHAMLSHDLWRALSQRTLFRLHQGPPPGPMCAAPTVPHPTVEDTVQSQELKAALDEQRTLTTALRAQMAEQATLLTALTQAIMQGGTIKGALVVSQAAAENAPHIYPCND